jgi:hypothetical protein
MLLKAPSKQLRTSIRNLCRNLKEDVVVDVSRRSLGHVCVLEEKVLQKRAMADARGLFEERAE